MSKWFAKNDAETIFDRLATPFVPFAATREAGRPPRRILYPNGQRTPR
jgi:hypothetical protein